MPPDNKNDARRLRFKIIKIRCARFSAAYVQARYEQGQIHLHGLDVCDLQDVGP